MQIVHQASLSALGLGVAFTVVWGVADPMAALAEVRVIEADGYYIMGDGPEENAAVAKERARADARRAASEQAGLYVAGMTEVKKGKLTRDEIRTISAAVLEVKEDNVTPEVLGGTVIQYHCHMKAVVDTSSITDQLRQDRQTFVEAVQRNKELEAENSRISAELAELKERYKTASESQKQEINREIKRNEDEFTAVQWSVKGTERYNQGDYKGAIECYQKAIKLDSKYAQPWYGMGCAYEKLDNIDKALECYQKSIEVNPKYEDPWHNMGLVYYNLGDYQRAIELCQKAIELNPGAKGVEISWKLVGDAYDELGNYEKALECYQKALEINPAHEVSWSNMGYTYNNMGNYNKAMECYQRALEIDSKDANIWSSMGYTCNNMGNYSEAIEYCRKAIDLDPSFANPWRHMGTAYKNLGNREKAIECYRKAIELNPNYEKAKEDLNALLG